MSRQQRSLNGQGNIGSRLKGNLQQRRCHTGFVLRSRKDDSHAAVSRGTARGTHLTPVKVVSAPMVPMTIPVKMYFQYAAPYMLGVYIQSSSDAITRTMPPTIGMRGWDTNRGYNLDLSVHRPVGTHVKKRQRIKLAMPSGNNRTAVSIDESLLMYMYWSLR